MPAAQLCLTLCDPMVCSWNSLGKNTGVAYNSLLQEIFPTQGSNPGLPHRRRILYRLSHRGSSYVTVQWYKIPLYGTNFFS